MQGVCMGCFVLLGVLMLLQWATQMSPRWAIQMALRWGCAGGEQVEIYGWGCKRTSIN